MDNKGFELLFKRIKRAFNTKNPIFIIVGEKKDQKGEMVGFEIECVNYGDYSDIRNVVYRALLQNKGLRDIILDVAGKFITEGRENTFNSIPTVISS